MDWRDLRGVAVEGNRLTVKSIISLALAGVLGAQPVVLPTPQFLEPLNHSVVLPARVTTGAAQGSAKMRLAAEMLQSGNPPAAAGTTITLWDYSVDSRPGVELNFLDRQLLTDPARRSQGYVIKTPDAQSVWIIGGGDQGVLYGAATLAQWVDGRSSVPGIYVRDYPDFEFRAASDWLLHVEVNRWAFDRGQGPEAYHALVKRKLERAARFKINMALIDGFGWSLDQRLAGYSGLMRDLNRFARERGIRLMYGGYGAAYDSAQSAGDYQGSVFLNRESYPDGHTYQCLAFPPKKHGLDPSTMGGCRGNDDLNRLKAEDLARFVDAVEPGALYIHHEDCCVFEDFQKAWLGRCERCRRRWPSDSLLAEDGGAGGLAHGYRALIEGINHVTHEGFAASRDTEIVLVSPVYMPMTSRSDDWGQVLQLWRTIARMLPKASNVQIAFREILPQAGGGRRWIELFTDAMKREGLPFRTFLFQVGGAENFLTDYPTTGAPAMDAHFLGARSIYNALGDPYHEPMEILAAEYGWNTRSTGFSRNPAKESDMDEIAPWVYQPGQPAEIYGPGKLFDRICTQLYGAEAGAEMAAYYRRTEYLPETPKAPSGEQHPYYRGRRGVYLPRTWDRVHAIPSYWNHYYLDSRTWSPEITDEGYLGGLKSLGIDTREAHRRLERRWKLAAELNAWGRERVNKALAAGPPADAREDLEFLIKLFDVHAPMIEALRALHKAAANPGSPEAFSLLYRAELYARDTAQRAAAAFPHPVDPAVGEVRTLREYPQKLLAAIAERRKR
ncbi:MAG: glycoside hydrolase family 20 zincin-like fold domain-containing protein [Bryobacteraceae bacterium]